MTVKEFYESCKCKSKLRVLSAYNGKILCYSYDPQKHTEIGERELFDIWADLQVTDSGFGNYAIPVLCCFASGTREYEKDMTRKAVERYDL